MALFGLFNKEKKEKLDKGLFITRQSFFSKLGNIVSGKKNVDADLLGDLEELLISSDIGVDTSMKIIERIKGRAEKERAIEVSDLHRLLREEISTMLTLSENSSETRREFNSSQNPYVIMVVGVNGVGKTTTIGKLANLFKKDSKSVILGAADTFRAAAVEQLKIWSERVDVPIVYQDMGADPASVAFDTVSSAVAKNADIAVIDTAGRLHNKLNLMNELTKIKKVMSKVIPGAPHEVLLILDASTGQNAIEQCKQFTAATEVTALALTKLDGTAKGGVAIGLCDQFNIPIKYVGVGEGIEDLELFDKDIFIESLFQENQ